LIVVQQLGGSVNSSGASIRMTVGAIQGWLGHYAGLSMRYLTQTIDIRISTYGITPVE
jgi:hypothetical protein